MTRFPLGLGLVACLSASAWAAGFVDDAAGVGQPPRDLTELSLSELANIRVTSVSKEPEERSRTAAAIYVITQDDIRRSGATSIPEALRLAPGVDVARIDSNQWSVGVRGFGDQFSKSVLVLIDGRNVYTPLFAGVDWEIQDVTLGDVERIEVIRGPGGTIWGTNAVNGVINIITRSARDTKGVLVSAIGGTLDQAIGEARYGGGNGTNLDYRVYGKAFTRGPQFHPDGKNYDDWRAGQAGFRADWTFTGGDTLTVQGDAYKGEYGENLGVASFSPPAQLIVNQNLEESGGNLRARWHRTLKSAGDIQIQAYYDRTDASAVHFKESRDTFDVDFIHHVALPGRQEVTWGLGARSGPDRFTQTIPTLDFQPRRRTISLYSAFLQDQVELVPDKLSATVGAKLEHNNYTGFEIMPSARLLWQATAKQTLWAAVTRAVRSPSRIEEDFRLNGFLLASPLIFVEIDGNHDVQSERVIGYDVGYRLLATTRLYVDVVAFHNEYDNLVSFGPGLFTADATPAPPHATLHFAYTNGVRGTTDGFEVAPDWKPTRWWRLKGWYSYLNFALENKPGNTDTGAVVTFEGSSPKHQVCVQSFLDLPGRLELDQTFRHVSALRARNVAAYSTVDLRLGWRLKPSLELSVVGQNLLQPHHAEFAHDPGPTVEMRRSAYAKLTWTR